MRRLVLATSARQYAAPGSLRAFGAEAGGAAGEAEPLSKGRGRGRGTPQAAAPAAPGAPGRGRGRGLPEGGLLARVLGAPAAQAAVPAPDKRAAGAPSEPRKPRDGTPREFTLRRAAGTPEAQPAAGGSGRPSPARAAEPAQARTPPTMRRAEGGGREISLRRADDGPAKPPQAGASGRPQAARDGSPAQRSRSPQMRSRDGVSRGSSNVELPASALALRERGDRRSSRWSEPVSVTERQPRGPMPVLPKIQRASALLRARPGAAARASTDEGGYDVDEEDPDVRLHRQQVSEMLDIAVDPLLDTSEVGIAPVLWGTQPERTTEEVIAHFAQAAELEYKRLGREYAQERAAFLRQHYARELAATSDEERRKVLLADQALLDAWLEQEIEASDAVAKKEAAARFAQVTAEADMLRDFEYAMAVRKGGSGLPHVAAEEAALAEVAAFAEGTGGEAYMRRMLPVLLRNSSITYADKQRALGVMLHRVAR